MIKVKWKSSADTQKILANLDKGLRNKAMRQALNAAAAPVKSDVQARAPKRFGYLKSAQRIKLANYKQKQVWVAIVGTKSDFKRTKSVGKKGKKKKVIIRPARYASIQDKRTHYISKANRKQFGAIFVQELKRRVAELMPSGK